MHMPNEPGADLVGTLEAAEILGRDRSTITRLVERGELEAHKAVPGRTAPLLFRRSDIETLRDARDGANR
jgi:excisionase family DNA binding protein